MARAKPQRERRFLARAAFLFQRAPEPGLLPPMLHRFLLVLCCLAAGSFSSSAASQIAPFKDDLFAYPQTLSTSEDGAFMTVDYQEMRDINGRDQVPERRVKSSYIALGVRKLQRDLVLQTGRGKIAHVAVGRDAGASMIVLYLHGKGGSRKQGVDDYTFGGNFNRVKNLVAAAGGLYLSPDFSDFGDRGAAEVAALLAHYAEASPGARVFVACGSMGGGICYRLACDPAVAPELGGLLLLGSHWDDSFLTSPAFKRRVPIFFGQGSRDPVFPLAKQAAFFRAIRAKAPNYPTRFVVFESGNHGTPIRMTAMSRLLMELSRSIACRWRRSRFGHGRTKSSVKNIPKLLTLAPPTPNLVYRRSLCSAAKA